MTSKYLSLGWTSYLSSKLKCLIAYYVSSLTVLKDSLTESPHSPVLVSLLRFHTQSPLPVSPVSVNVVFPFCISQTSEAHSYNLLSCPPPSYSSQRPVHVDPSPHPRLLSKLLIFLSWNSAIVTQLASLYPPLGPFICFLHSSQCDPLKHTSHYVTPVLEPMVCFSQLLGQISESLTLLP